MPKVCHIVGRVITQLITSGDTEQARRKWPTYAELFQNATNRLEDLYNDQFNNYNALSREKSDLIQFSLGVIVVSTLLCIMLGSLLALLFSRCIGQPIAQIQQYVDEVAVGNLSGVVAVENRDELGRLAQVLSLAVNNLRRVIGGSQVGDHLKELAETLNNSSHQQASGSTQQLSSARELIATMEQLTQRSQQISRNAANVAQATEQTSRRMGNLQTVARQAESMVTELQQAVTHTVSNMEEVSHTVTKLTQELDELTEQTRQIGKVIELISGVSEEVHLLALNAAIEAVGAGQHGQRFGVVASEVKSLANRTKQNAGQITLLVKQVQQSSLEAQQRALQTSQIAQNVVNTNEKLKMVVFGIDQTVAQTVLVATETFEAARSVDTQVEAIKYATQEQMNASLQVSEALQQIGRMAEENVVASRYIAASTTQLDNISEKLVDILSGVSLS